MFNDIFDRLGFGDMDSRKLMDAVNFVWTHREQISDLIERLPTLLNETGSNIEAAGASAVKASAFLTGGPGGQGGVKHMAVTAAEALDEGQRELSEVAAMLGRLGTELDRIAIPTVAPRFTNVAGFNVMSGLDIGHNSLFDDVTDRMQGSADRLTAMSGNLQTVATQLRDMGELLQGMGGDLNRVGGQLQSSGKTLKSLGELRTSDNQ